MLKIFLSLTILLRNEIFAFSEVCLEQGECLQGVSVGIHPAFRYSSITFSICYQWFQYFPIVSVLKSATISAKRMNIAHISPSMRLTVTAF